MRFHTQDDEILLADIGDAARRLNLGDGLLALFDQPQAFRIDRREMRGRGR